jgi:hypothetical protein
MSTIKSLRFLEDVVRTVFGDTTAKNTSRRFDQGLRSVQALVWTVTVDMIWPTAAAAEILVQLRIESAPHVLIHVVITPGGNHGVVFTAVHVMVFLEDIIGTVHGKIPAADTVLRLFYELTTTDALFRALGRILEALASILVEFR